MRRFSFVLILWAASTVMVWSAEPVRLTLGEALHKAGTQSVGVLVGQARVQQALGQLEEARSLLLPQITGTVGGARQSRDLRGIGITLPGMDPHISPFNSFDARARITQSIFDAGAFERLRAAKLGERLSTVQMQKAHQDVLALAATLYIQAQRAQGHAAIMQVVLTRDRKALDLAKVGVRQGIGSRLEYKKAKADYAQSVYLFRVAKAEAVRKRLDLAALLKIPSDMPIIFVDQDNQHLWAKAAAVDAQISLDVHVAQEQLNVDKAEAAAARGDYLPKIAAMGDYGRAGESPRNGSNTYTVGLQASIPIWEGGRRQAKVKQANAQTKASEAQLDDIERRTQARLIDARQSIATARALIASKNAQLAAVKEQMAIASNRVSWGTGYELDVNTAAAQKALIEDEQQEAKALFQTAVVSLLHAKGRIENLLKE